jgi:hypothetical protein
MFSLQNCSGEFSSLQILRRGLKRNKIIIIIGSEWYVLLSLSCIAFEVAVNPESEVAKVA